MKKYFLALIAFISIIGTVNASDCWNTSFTYYAKSFIGGRLSDLSGADTNRYIFTKNSYNGELVGYGFCIAPKKPGNSAIAAADDCLHHCTKLFAPTGKYSKAMAYAYQYLYNNNYFKDSGKSTEELVLTPLLTFRWIASIYEHLYTSGDHSEDNLTISTVKKGSMNEDMNYIVNNHFSNKAKDAAAKAKDIVTDAINVAENNDMSKIWQPTFTTTVLKHPLNDAKTRSRVRVRVRGNGVKNVLWDQTEVSCGANCEIKSMDECKDGKADDCREIVVAVANTTDCNFNINFTIHHNDLRDAGNFLMEVVARDEGSTHQAFIIARTVGYDNGGHTSVSVPNPTDCGPPPPPPPNPKCTYIDGAGGRVYYDSSGNASTDPTNYRFFCLHQCTAVAGQPDSYYCPSTDPDNDRICSYDEYIAECTYCGKNKAQCQATPDTPECVRYWQECPECNPSVSMPSTCSDFDVESNLTGTISDINTEKTSCNYSVKPVKGCVIAGKDAAGNTYQVDVPELRENRYCKLYCYEEYKFTVPTAQYSTSGGYFNLSMQVTGTRNCYVGNPSSKLNGVSMINETNMADFFWDIERLYNRLYEALGIDVNNNYFFSLKKSSSDVFSIFNYSDFIRDYITNLNETIDKVVEAKYDKEFNQAYGISERDDGFYYSRFGSYENYLNEKKSFRKEEKSRDKKEKKELIISILNEINSIIKMYQQCTDPNIMKNDLKFEPKIEYKYQEYQGKYSTGAFSKVGEDRVESQSLKYCYGATDPQYNCTYANRKNQLKPPDSYYSEPGNLDRNNEYWYRFFDEIGLTNHEIIPSTPIEYSSNNLYESPTTGNYRFVIPGMSCDTIKVREIPMGVDCYRENPYAIGTSEYYNFINKCDARGGTFEGPNPYPENTPQYFQFEDRFKIVDYKFTCEKTYTSVNRAIGLSNSITKTANYMPNQNFKTYHQYGTIVTGDPCVGTGFTDCLWTRLPETSLPVELKTGKGAFPFTLYFKNIGQFGNGSLGRLVGSSNSVLNSYNNLPADKKCSVNGTHVNFGALTQDVGYVCAYVNNCDNCDVSCSIGGCDLHECTGPDCPVKCKTCIFDGNNTTFKYRTISLNNVFPNTCSESNKNNCRYEGYNWNFGNSPRTPTNLKAQKTVEEIETLGEKAYENDNLEYSYTLTPANLRALRDYNRNAKTYANTTIPKDGSNSLQCEQVTYNGLTYSVRCKSSFLRDVANEGLYFVTNKINNTFKLWSETDGCLNGSCLSRKDGIGPSWK